MANFERIPGKFAYSGMDIHHPNDLLPAGKVSLLFNMQPDTQNGTLSMRPAIANLATTPAGVAIHSIARLNDSVPEAVNPFSRFVGAGTKIYSGAGGALAQLDTGYSGNPVAFVPYRPNQSPESWLYTYDSAKQQRYKADNATKQNIGIAAPTAEPSLARIQPLYDMVDPADNAGLWSSGTPSGGSVSAVSRVARLSTTALALLYDSGSTGMASIVPASTANTWMLGGSMVILSGTEHVYIEEAFAPLGGYGGSTTIAAIAYDSGSTGPCTIVPSIPLPGLARNSVVYLNGVLYVRVLSVTAGPDGSYSFRSNTGVTTIAAGQTIAGVPSFRCWTVGSYSSGVALTGFSLTATFTPTVSGGSMTDIVSSSSPVTGNLSFAGARPLQNEDYMHLSLAFDQPSYVTEVHVLLDVDATTNDFNHNYYYYVLRQGDFVQSLSGAGGASTLTSLSNAVSNSIVSELALSENIGLGTAQPPYPIPENPSTSAPAPQQTAYGTLAWLEAMFKLNDLTRVGSDQSRTLANVAKIGLYVFTSGGVVNMYWGGWWAGGGYGPDCNFNSYGNQAPEIQWRYRYRNSLTGAHSTVSPETRNGEILRRQAINLTVQNSPDAQTDTIDFERRGGTNPDWHYVGSVPQGVATTTFLDNVTESAAQIGDPLEVACYQPWPVTDIPHSGTATVVGTSVVWLSGDTFNLRWLRGTEIILGGNTFSLYAPPTSPTALQLAQNVPPPSGVYTFSISEATIEGQPLYGAWLDEANNRVLTVGDPLNPGLLYFTNNDNPDGASDSGYLEVTSPSEKLLNGFYAEGSNYVFSYSSLYRVQNGSGANPYASYRLSGLEGIAGAWAFDCQRRILFYWGPDGIYSYAFGAAAENLTENDLYPLFPHAGSPGEPGIPGVPVSISGQTVFPPAYSLSQYLRIGYNEGFVYATYQTSGGGINALVYSIAARGWRQDIYLPGVSLFAVEKGVPNPLLMAGGVDGNLYSVDPTGTLTADPGGPIEWVVLLPSKDAGDSRAVKQWGDALLDYSASSTFGLQVLWDNLLIDGVNPSPAASAQRTRILIDLFTFPDTNDTPLIHYNMSVLLAGTGPVMFYEWQPSFLPLPEISTARVTSWRGALPGAGLHYAFVQGVRLHGNTFGIPKQVQVQYDGYQLGPIITVNMQGQQTIPYSFQTPFKAHMLRIVPLDDVPWELWDDSEWIAEPEPEPATYWISQPTALGQHGYMHCREIWTAYAGSGVVSVIVDGQTPVTLANLPAAATPVKTYNPCPPLKGRYWQLTASGSSLQLYERDIEFLMKSWGSTGQYARVRPFGDMSGGGGASGAKI